MTNSAGYVLWTDGVFVSTSGFPLMVVRRSEPQISIERVRQPLTAILGYLDLALQAAEEARPHDEDAPGYADVRQARAAALRLRDMCTEAEHTPKEIDP